MRSPRPGGLGVLALLPLLACACRSEPPGPALLRLADLVPAAGTAERSYVELDHLAMPALSPEGPVEIPLPDGLPSVAVFEAAVGLDPAHAPPFRGGVTFRAGCKAGGRTLRWVARGFEAAELDEWRSFSTEVEVPPSCTVVLEASVTEEGRDGGPPRALWGNPRLRFGPAPDPPLHLVVIGVDTLRADVVGAYGNTEGLTPHLDLLARDSVLLRDLTAPSPWTLPSFASLLTGVQPQTHGGGRRLNSAPRLRDVRFSPVDPGIATLAEVLARAGYATGSVFTNPFLGVPFGVHRGFDEHREVPHPAAAGAAVDRALEWLDHRAGAPVFLFLQLIDPHTPYAPPEPFCRQVARRLAPAFAGADCSVSRSNDPGRRTPVGLRPWAAALYRAEVAYTDQQIGRFLAALEDRGLRDRTVVLVTSDHGEELWERGEQLGRMGYHAVADHGHTLYQELLRVPGILSIPERPPQVIEGPAELVDLFPTLLASLGVEAPGHEGRDLLSRESEARRRTRIASFLLYGSERWSVMRGPWKLIHQPDAELSELYHLGFDPGERHDLAAAEPETLAALLAAGRAELERRNTGREGPGTAGAGGPGLRPEDVERLRALGYLD